MWLLDCRVVLYLIFWGTFILFTMVATTVCIPTHSWRGFPFIHVLPTPALSCAFDDSHSDRREVISHCSLHLHFPDDGWWWTSFDGAVGHQYSFFGEMSVHVFCLFFNWIFVFRGLSRISSICFGHNPCIEYDICEYLLPLSRLSYYSYVFIVLLLCGNFSFWVSPNSFFLLLFSLP